MNSTETAITLRQLKELGACSDQVELFCRTFPGGHAAMTAGNLRIALTAKLDVEWYANKVLPAPALQAYKATTYQALQAYVAAKAPAWQAYKAAKAPAWQAYKATTDQALQAYEATTYQALQAYEAVKDQALQAYEAATAPAWQAYKAATAPAWQAYKAATDQALIVAFNLAEETPRQAIASDWLKPAEEERTR